MSKNRYKRHSRGGRFRQQGDGLRSAVDNIRQQRQTEIDALKLQAQQQKEQSKLQISGLSDVAQNKVDNQRILNNLENKIYQNKRNAIDIRGRREVEGILGEAAELGKEAEFWENFATKHSQNYSKLAGGLTEYAQYRAAVNAYEKMTKEEKLLFLEPYEGAYDDVEWNSEKAAWEIPDWKDKKELFKRTHGWFANNHHLHKMLANDYIKTINERVSMIRLNSKTADGEELYNKDSASQLLLNSAYQYLYSSGIPFNSAAGQKILAATNQQIASETNKYSLANEVREDNKNIEIQTKMLASFKTDYYDVPIIGEGLGPVKSGKTAFEDKFWVLHDTLRGSAKMGEYNSGVLLASDPIRQSETHKQQLTDTLEHILKHIDFSSESEAISMLNIPVRNMETGKIVYKKDGKTPAEFLLDKHPDLKQLVAQKVKDKNKDIISDNELKSQTDAIAAITPFNEQVLKSFKSNDFSETLHNKEWRINFFNVLNDPKHKHLQIVQDGFNLLGFEPESFKNETGWNANTYKLFTQVEQEFYSGDTNGAMFSYMKLKEEVPELANIYGALADTLQVVDFQKETLKYIKNEFKPAGFKDASVIGAAIPNQNKLDRMIEIGTGRFMAIWEELSTGENKIVDPLQRWAKVKEQFSKEVEQGLVNRKGWAAATDQSTFTGTQEGDTKIQSMGKVFKFDILEGTTDVVETGEVDLDKQEIAKLFSTYESELYNLQQQQPNADFFGSKDQNEINKSKVSGIIYNNFEDLISINDARSLLANISTGQAANNDLPNNIKLLVRRSKSLYNLTERETMNLVIGAIVEKGNDTWGDATQIDDQLKNYEWPPNLDDFVKSIGGTVTGNPKDIQGQVIYQFLKAQGYNLQDLIIDQVKQSWGVNY